MIEGGVPRPALPTLPKGYTWNLSEITVKYRRKTSRYVFRTYKVKESIQSFRIVKGRRRKYIKIVVSKVRKRYPVYAVVHKKEAWWTIEKRQKIKKLKKAGEQFLPAADYLEQKIKTYGIDPDEVEQEIELPYDYVEKNTGFSHFEKIIPSQRTYNMLFLYYMISIYSLKENRIIFTHSSFDLGGEYTMEQIANNMVPEAIKTTIDRFERSRSPITFAGYVSFSCTTKRALESGKE